MSAFFLWVKKHYRWLIPVLFSIIITPFTPYWDLAIARFFYVPDSPETNNFISNTITDIFYDYGEIPAWILFGIACIILGLSYYNSSWIKWRAGMLVIIITMFIGPGLIINVMLKEHWGRARPKQVIEFGGNKQFSPYYRPNFIYPTEQFKSFPSGHSAMGFYFLTLALVGQHYKKNGLIYTGFTIAILLGISLSITRMAQGGHFFTDVLMSSIIMWLTALSVGWYVYRRNKIGFGKFTIDY